MVNSKVIGGIIVSIAIITIAAFGLNQVQENNSETNVRNSVNDSSVSVTDSATLIKNNAEFIVDDEGNKKYIISASDSPTLED